MAKNILVVDNSASVRTLVKMALERVGYVVVEAGNGKVALAKLTGTKVDLIVSDANLPDMDGNTFMVQLKANAKAKATPVIMLITDVQAANKEQKNAAAWIVKPFSLPMLLDAVGKLI